METHSHVTYCHLTVMVRKYSSMSDFQSVVDRGYLSRIFQESRPMTGRASDPKISSFLDLCVGDQSGKPPECCISRASPMERRVARPDDDSSVRSLTCWPSARNSIAGSLRRRKHLSSLNGENSLISLSRSTSTHTAFTP